MTLCSWIRNNKLKSGDDEKSIAPVPSNHEIQNILVKIGDKENDFISSKQWIGSIEVNIGNKMYFFIYKTLDTRRCCIYIYKSFKHNFP